MKPINMKDRTIAIVGLGYVGLPLAVEFGKRRAVIGFDIKEDRIAELKAGHDNTLEVSDEDLRQATLLKFTANIASLRCPEESSSRNEDDPMIFIVTVPTPVDKANRPDLTPLVNATVTVGGLLKSGDIVIYESTVYPGCTEEICVPILKRESKLKYLTEDNDTIGFYCGYSPERINPGDKTHRLRDIKKVTSGSTPEIAKAISALYQEIIVAGIHQASSIKVAEAAKVIENAQRDLNIAFVNELSIIFKKMDIDTSEVLAAAATKWNFLHFKPGLVGGHCIGVDPYYLTHKAQALGYNPKVILSGRETNDSMAFYVATNVINLMMDHGVNIRDAVIGVFGITFKENCPDVRNSKVIQIIEILKENGLTVKVTDPWADVKEVERAYGITLSEVTDEDTLDAIIICVAHDQFLEIEPKKLRAYCARQNSPVIADLKSIYNKKDLISLGFNVFRL